MKLDLPRREGGLYRKDIYDAMDILKRIQSDLYQEGKIEAWLIVTRAYEHIAARL